MHSGARTVKPGRTRSRSIHRFPLPLFRFPRGSGGPGLGQRPDDAGMKAARAIERTAPAPAPSPGSPLPWGNRRGGARRTLFHTLQRPFQPQRPVPASTHRTPRVPAPLPLPPRKRGPRSWPTPQRCRMKTARVIERTALALAPNPWVPASAGKSEGRCAESAFHPPQPRFTRGASRTPQRPSPASTHRDRATASHHLQLPPPAFRFPRGSGGPGLSQRPTMPG
jgi:hypothetical protein